jgi:hypothetical protein
MLRPQALARSASRAGRLAMILRRSAAVSRDHVAISCKVRPQPVQSPDGLSIVQILMQGLSMRVFVRRVTRRT